MMKRRIFPLIHHISMFIWWVGSYQTALLSLNERTSEKNGQYFSKSNENPENHYNAIKIMTK